MDLFLRILYAGMTLFCVVAGVLVYDVKHPFSALIMFITGIICFCALCFLVRNDK